MTGAGHLDTDAVGQMIPRIREHVKVPVGVGFGIRDARTAQAVGSVADAVVIGTRIIQLIEDQPREAVVPRGARIPAPASGRRSTLCPPPRPRTRLADNHRQHKEPP